MVVSVQTINRAWKIDSICRLCLVIIWWKCGPAQREHCPPCSSFYTSINSRNKRLYMSFVLLGKKNKEGQRPKWIKKKKVSEGDYKSTWFYDPIIRFGVVKRRFFVSRVKIWIIWVHAQEAAKVKRVYLCLNWFHAAFLDFYISWYLGLNN